MNEGNDENPDQSLSGSNRHPHLPMPWPDQQVCVGPWDPGSSQRPCSVADLRNLKENPPHNWWNSPPRIRHHLPVSRGIFKKEGNRSVQNSGNFLKTACTNAVGPFFVFLDLLKGNSQGIAQFFLAHSDHGAAQSDAAANMNINWIGFSFFGSHNCLFLRLLRHWKRGASFRIRLRVSSRLVWVRLVLWVLDRRKCDPYCRQPYSRICGYSDCLAIYDRFLTYKSNLRCVIFFVIFIKLHN